MSIVRAVRNKLIWRLAISYAMLGAVFAAIFVSGKWWFLIPWSLWTLWEVYGMCRNVVALRLLRGLTSAEPEELIATLIRREGAPGIVKLQNPFDPRSKTDTFEVQPLFQNLAGAVMPANQELTVTAYRAFDPRSACVIDISGEPVLLMPTTAVHDAAQWQFQKGCMYLDKPDLAMSELSKAIDQCGDHVEARLLRAHLYLDRHEYDSAISDLNVAIKNFPVSKEYPDAYALRAIAYFYKQMYEYAATDFTESLKRAPDNVEYRAYRGFCYFQLGQRVPAQEDLSLVIKADPYHNRSRALLAHIYVESSEPARALALIEEMPADSKPSDGEQKLLLTARGLAEGALFRRDAAVASFSRVIELDPTDEYAYRCRAAQYSGAPGGHKLSEQDIERADQLAALREQNGAAISLSMGETGSGMGASMAARTEAPPLSGSARSADSNDRTGSGAGNNLRDVPEAHIGRSSGDKTLPPLPPPPTVSSGKPGPEISLFDAPSGDSGLNDLQFAPPADVDARQCDTHELMEPLNSDRDAADNGDVSTASESFPSPAAEPLSRQSQGPSTTVPGLLARLADQVTDKPTDSTADNSMVVVYGEGGADDSSATVRGGANLELSGNPGTGANVTEVSPKGSNAPRIERRKTDADKLAVGAMDFFIFSNDPFARWTLRAGLKILAVGAMLSLIEMVPWNAEQPFYPMFAGSIWLGIVAAHTVCTHALCRRAGGTGSLKSTITIYAYAMGLCVAALTWIPRLGLGMAYIAGIFIALQGLTSRHKLNDKVAAFCGLAPGLVALSVVALLVALHQLHF